MCVRVPNSKATKIMCANQKVYAQCMEHGEIIGIEADRNMTTKCGSG